LANHPWSYTGVQLGRPTVIDVTMASIMESGSRRPMLNRNERLVASPRPFCGAEHGRGHPGWRNAGLGREGGSACGISSAAGPALYPDLLVGEVGTASPAILLGDFNRVPARRSGLFTRCYDADLSSNKVSPARSAYRFDILWRYCGSAEHMR
jgi:hypothetical protein